MTSADLKLSLSRLEAVSQEITSGKPDSRTWVVLYPHKLKTEQNLADAIRVRIRIVSIPNDELLKRDFNLDGDESFVIDHVNVVVERIDDVLPLLQNYGLSCGDFLTAFESNLPF